MKKIYTTQLTSFFGLSFALVFGLALPYAALAATAPTLGGLSTYGIVSTTHTNSNTAPQSIVNGDVCATTHTVPLPLTITGATVTPCDPARGTEQSAALAVLNDVSQSCVALVTPSTLSGTFTPGCYSTAGAINMADNAILTLDGAGVYIFKSGGALTTGANTSIVLSGGATAGDVYWAPVGLASIGVFTTGGIPPVGPTFIGNIFDAAGITVGHFANVSGRLLSFGATITTDANTITVPSASALATLHIIKTVVNNGGGSATPSAFSMHVKLAGSEVVGSPLAGAVSPGTAYSLAAGTYVVSEDAVSLYTTSFSASCPNGSITLSASDDVTCTVTNTYVPPSIASAGSQGGYVAQSPHVLPLIGLLKVPSPLTFVSGPRLVTYTYTVNTAGGAKSLANVLVTDDKCSPLVLVSGDSNNDGKLDQAENWKYTCTSSLATTTTNTATAVAYSDDSYNEATIATAIATVVVGTSATPPLLSIAKVPSRLSPLSPGGEVVTYTYTVTNPGVVSMHDVTVTDDKCAPVSGPTGDTNNNALLDVTEVWTYHCLSAITVSTRNVATATGKANGFTALGYAFATVLVSTSTVTASPVAYTPSALSSALQTPTPGLPDTGFPPPQNETAHVAFLVVASSLAIMLALLFFTTDVLTK